MAHATYTPVSTVRVLYFKHHVTGEAWPADSDSTLNFKGGSRRGGESKGVKFRIIRKRREPFSSLPRSHGGSKFLFVEMVTRNNDF